MKNIEVFNRLKELDEIEVLLSGALQTKSNIAMLDNLEESITTTKFNLHGIQMTEFETMATIMVDDNTVMFKICEDSPWVAICEDFVNNLGYGEQITVVYRKNSKELVQLEMFDKLSE